MQNKNVSMFPPPPPYYKQYGTTETMLKPPKPITGEYNVFGIPVTTVKQQSLRGK